MDSDQLTSTGLFSILAEADDIDVVGEADTAEEASRLAHLHRPGIIVSTWPLDRLLESLRGITRLPQQRPIRIVLLTGAGDTPLPAPSPGPSVAAVIPRDGFRPTELRAVVRLAGAGYYLFEEPIARALIAASDQTGPAGQAAEIQALTDREREVLRLIAAGHKNAEIAGELMIAESTVKSHVRSVLDKLEVRDRVQAAIYARESGIISSAIPT